jgi:hypothetical protein
MFSKGLCYDPTVTPQSSISTNQISCPAYSQPTPDNKNCQCVSGYENISGICSLKCGNHSSRMGVTCICDVGY